jgi:hypothetical protein
MKPQPTRVIYTILADDKPIVALSANGREAAELCKEAWFLEELASLKSDGAPLYESGTKLRARPAIEAELIRYQHVSDKAQSSDEILFAYLVELDHA